MAVVVVAVVVIVVLGRNGDPGGEPAVAVVDVDGDGLRLSGEAAPLVRWDEVWEVVVVTRREVRGTWFGFEVRVEGHGLVTVAGPGGLGERFLAECHRFPGFDHHGLGDALASRRPRLVCFSR